MSPWGSCKTLGEGLGLSCALEEKVVCYDEDNVENTLNENENNVAFSPIHHLNPSCFLKHLPSKRSHRYVFEYFFYSKVIFLRRRMFLSFTFFLFFCLSFVRAVARPVIFIAFMALHLVVIFPAEARLSVYWRMTPRTSSSPTLPPAFPVNQRHLFSSLS